MKNSVNKLYLGDCLDILPTLSNSSLGLVLADPPYETTSCSWDVIIPFEPMWREIERLRKETCPVLLFSSQPYTTQLIASNMKNYKYELIWKKNVPTGMAQAKYRPMKYHETIQCFYMTGTTYNPIMKPRVGKHKECYRYDHYCGENNHIKVDKVKKRYDPDFVQPSSVLEFNVVPNRNGKLHPTQKPVDLMEYLIKTYSNEGDTVLDFCAGSGTTAIACLNTGRNYICIEKEEKYYQKMVRRVEEYESESC